MTETAIPRVRTDVEAQIGRAFIRFEKEYMGRGPLETRTYLIDDMILVRLKGVLTPAEQKLSETNCQRSTYLLKQVRNELLSSGRAKLEAIIQDVVGVAVQSLHTDISTKTGERIVVITLREKPVLVKTDRSPGANGRPEASGEDHGLSSASAPLDTSDEERRNGRIRR